MAPQANKNKKREMPVNTLVRFIILGWSAGLMTFSYMGVLPKMDPTFIASIFTGTLATFGVDTMRKKDDEDEVKNVTGNSTNSTGPGPGRPRKTPAADTATSSQGPTTTSNPVP